MSIIATLRKRLDKVSIALFPPVKETRLPYLVLVPGHEEHNAEHERLARRLRVPANVYIGFDPNDDGIEP